MFSEASPHIQTSISLLIAFFAAVVGSVLAEPMPRDFAVEASADVQLNPPEITLRWPADPKALSYTVSRKALNATTWSAGVDLPASATSYVDTNVEVGGTYEYQIRKPNTDGFTGYGYVYAGIQAPLIDQRGKVILVVDASHAADLGNELARFHEDLVGDGWIVVRRDVSRDDSPPAVKARIKSEYDADPQNVRAVFLFGKVPVPYSGDIFPDGHENHRGAWPADVYYGEMDGLWTDNLITSTNAEREVNWNMPNDGKFDQSVIPSDIDLEVGRVDLSDMTNFANKEPPRFERDLLRQYLNKNHNFRHGRVKVQRRAVIVDNFGLRGTDGVAANGFRTFSAFFGAANTRELPIDTFVPTLSKESYLWCWGAGGGSYYYSSGVARADDFSTNDFQVVFTMFLGSYYGDWNNESNFLRSALGGQTYTLATAYSGFPHTFFHHMALGHTIGHGIRLSQNNATNGVYRPQGQGTRQVHVALLGDPTLRMHPVLPPGELTATRTANGIALSWGLSTDTDIVGYHVYRADSRHGPFVRLTAAPISETRFLDPTGTVDLSYMVRAIKLEISGSGTYFNASQGVFVNEWSEPVDPKPVQLVRPAANASQFSFGIQGEIGQLVVIERSDELAGWTPVATNTLTSTILEFEIAIDGAAGKRFFRVRSE